MVIEDAFVGVVLGDGDDDGDVLLLLDNDLDHLLVIVNICNTLLKR